MATLAGYFTDLADAERAARDLAMHGLPPGCVALVTTGPDVDAVDRAAALVIADCPEATDESVANVLRRNGAFDIQDRDAATGIIPAGPHATG